MKTVIKKFRFSYWWFKSFFSKHIKVIIAVFVAVFLFIYFSSTLLDFISVLFTFNKYKIGLVYSQISTNLPTEVLSKISRPLFYYNKRGELVPQLAKKISVGKNGREYTVFLKKDLLWQDGSDFTTQTINKRQLEFKNTKTEIINDYTIKFILKDKLSTFPGFLTTPILKDSFIGIEGEYAIRNIKYHYGEISSIILSPIENNLPVLVYRMYKNQDDLVLGYKLGEIDEFSTYSNDVKKEVESWKNTNIEEIVDVKKIVTLFINTQKAPFDNKTIRQAIAQGIDYKKLEKNGVRANTSILPFSWSYNANVKTYSYEPEVAKGLIEENLPNSQTYELYTSYDLSPVSELIQKSLAGIGINVELRYTNYTPTDYDMFLVILEPSIDPDQYVFWHQTQQATNFSKVKDVRIDKLLEDGRQKQGRKQRKKIYYKFQELIAEEVPAVFLYYPRLYIVRRK